MNGRYECAWESVRPVPRIDIDFGDGRKLTRTLQGNVATYLCTSDGRVTDIIPGVYDREPYLRRLASAPVTPPAAVQVADFGKKRVEARVIREVADTGKYEVERPVKALLTPLAADTAHNESVRMPKIRAMLAANPQARPADLKVALFRDVLGYDLEDPWLGLAPMVIGGEGGRS